MIRMMSDRSVPVKIWLATGIAAVIRPWKRQVPISTLAMLTLLAVAPPTRTAATAGKAMFSGPL